MVSSLSLGQGVENALHVLFLLELVDELEGFVGLRLGQLGRGQTQILVLGGHRRNAARLERLLQSAEVLESAAQYQLRLALLAKALAHLIQAVVDHLELELVLIDTGRLEPKDAQFAKLKAHAAGRAEVATVAG